MYAWSSQWLGEKLAPENVSTVIQIKKLPQLRKIKAVIEDNAALPQLSALEGRARFA